MTRRKRKNEPDDTGETLSEDTREMWTVAGESRVEDEPTEEWEQEDLPESDWQDESGSDEDWVEGDESGEYLGDEDEPGDDWVEGDDEPLDEWADDGEPDEGWVEEEEPEPENAPGVGQRRPLWSRLESIDWPALPEPDPRRLLAGVAVLAAALLVGFGTYQLGKSGGPDLDTARIEGEASGRQAGAVEGAKTGYPAGYRKGREAGFARAYRQNYRIYYRRAFEQAGLDAPGEGEIKVPTP